MKVKPNCLTGESIKCVNEIQAALQLTNIFLAIHPANVYAFVYEMHENFCSNDTHSVTDNCISSVPID